MLDKYKSIDSIVCREVGRNIAALIDYTKNDLYSASHSLINSTDVGIITGFYVPRANPPAAETDGPLGTVILASALESCGIEVRIATDILCQPVLQTAIDYIDKTIILDIIDEQNISNHIDLWDNLSHVISIERPGITKDGKPHNMLGHDISEHTVNLDALYTSSNGIKIAIGDGGNEIGMGKIPAHIIEGNIKNGSDIACVTSCDHLIVAGVSNWGAYGIIATLALLKSEWKNTLIKYLDPDLEFNILREIVKKANAVDGTTAKQEFTVDALSLDIHSKVINDLRKIINT